MLPPQEFIKINLLETILRYEGNYKGKTIFRAKDYIN